MLSEPVTPSALASMNAQGTLASTSETSKSPAFGSVIMSTVLPVGNRLPVRVPPRVGVAEDERLERLQSVVLL